MEKIEHAVLIESPLRVDKYLSDQFPEHTRSYYQNLIKEGQVVVNKKVCKSNYKVEAGDILEMCIPDAILLDVSAEDMNLDIYYEDEHLLIVNKPQGMVVHPAAGNLEHTLVNGIMHHCKGQLSSINGVIRPGIVHRIDKDTSGLLIVCKSDLAHVSIAEQLKEHSVVRKYEAIVYNNIVEEQGTIHGPIGRHPVERKMMCINEKNGKPATTHFRVLERLGRHQFTYVELQLETGRTHQIRVHMSSAHHPLLGDPVYGPKKSPYPINGQLLHAKTIGFIHPVSKEYMEFNAPLPEYFRSMLETLRHK